MDYQICDFAPSDLGTAVRLLEALRAVPDSAPMEIAQFIFDVNNGAVAVVALANGALVGLASARVAGDRAWTQLVAIGVAKSSTVTFGTAPPAWNVKKR